MKWNRIKSCLCVLFACFLTGCGSEDFKVAPVSGTVKLGGKPLANATVAFQPKGAKVAGPMASSITDEQGHYTLRLISDGSEGAVIGEHIVWISTGQPADPNADASPIVGELVPKKYLNGSLRFTVEEEGTQEANFDL